MKHVGFLAVGAVGLVVAGCAGSGSTAGTAIDASIVVGPRVEAVVSKGGVVQVDGSGAPIVQDSRNFEINMEFTFQLVGYKATGERVVLNPKAWVSSDDSSTYGNLATNSGLYMTNTQVTSAPYTVSALYNGVQYSTNVGVHPREVILTGKVANENTSVGLSGVSINFYNPDGTLVSTVSTAYNGTFRASVPTTAASMQLTHDSIPTGYYHSYVFFFTRFNVGESNCKAAIPSYADGVRDLGDTIKVTPQTPGVPTPDPTGCM